MSTSSPELTIPTSAGTTQSAQPADLPSVKATGDIRQAIAHTREQLADTVEELVHEIDLPARVMDKAHQSKEAVQVKVDEVKQQLHRGSETVQDKAEKATWRAKNLTRQALAKLSPPVASRAKGLMAAVRQKPAPAAVAALGILVVFRRLLRRSGR